MALAPEHLVREARRKGVDVEAVIVRALARVLGLDPREEAKAHIEIAEKFLAEGLRLLEDGDVVQASEKLYKAAGEAVRAAALLLGMKDVLERVEARG